MERERTTISPIQYLEATCDRCSKEIQNYLEDIEFGILRNGQLVCTECRDQRPDHEHFKNFNLPKTYEPEKDPELIPDEDRPEDPTIVDTSGVFEGDVPTEKFKGLPPEKYYCQKCKGYHFRHSIVGNKHANFETQEPEQ